MKIKYNEMELEIDVDYTPGERPVFYYPDGSGYPGSGPSLEFKILTEGLEIDAFILEDLEAIESLIWLNITNENTFGPDFLKDNCDNEH